MRNDAGMRELVKDVPPFRYSQLPSGWNRLELDYRTNPPTSQPDKEAGSTLIVHALVAVAAMLVVRFFGPLLLSATGVLMSLVLAAPAAIRARFRAQDGRKAALILLSGPAILLVLVGCHYATNHAIPRVAVMIIAIGVVVWLVDQITEHSVYWMLANPRLTKQQRLQRRARWASRRSVVLPAPVGEIDRREAKELRSYTLRCLFPLAYVALAILPGEGPTTLLVLILPPALALALATFRLRRFPDASPLTRAWEALANWFSYGRKTPPSPGVFQSPVGPAAHRALLHLLTTALVASALIPSHSYLPIVFELSPQDSWQAPFDRVKANIPPNERRAFAERLGHSFPDEARYPTREQKRTYGRHLDHAWKTLSVSAYVRNEPEGWVNLARLGGGELHFWALIVSLLVCLVLPTLVIGSSLLFIGAPYLGMLYDAVESPEATDVEERGGLSTWACHVARLQEASDPLEREHLWLGAHVDYDCPILLHEPILREHAYLVGDSGSGKTALGLTPVLTQLIQNTDAAVVIIDLKGDAPLFDAARREAMASRRTFKWFTNELGRSTYAFNPFTQQPEGRVSLNQICETLLEALNLNHGEGYGRSYFSRVARRWLSATLRRERGNVKSFKQLYELSQKAEHLTQKEKQDAFELIAVVESLASFEQMNMRPTPDTPDEVLDSAIHLPSAIAEGQVIYFWLPAAVESATVREIAKLALYSLLQAAFVATRDAGSERRQTYLVIDEFQRMASENFKIILEQARSMGIGAILANQTMQDLKTNDVDLRPTVQTNTRFKQCFSATDLDQQDNLIKASGEALYFSKTFTDIAKTISSATSTRTVTASSISQAENVQPRLQRNDIILASDHPLHSVVQVARGSGYTQHGGFSMPIEGAFYITEEEYRRRSAAPWPGRTVETLIPTEKWMEPDDYATVEDRLQDTSRVFDDEDDDLLVE